MTLILDGVSKCAICGTTVKHKMLVSTNTFGFPDLDFRPSEMKRSTMDYWTVQCPACGFADSRIDDKISKKERKRLEAILKSESYRNCDGWDLPDETARRFYRQYLLYKEVEKDYRLFLILKHCIWECDNFGPCCEEVSKNLRCKAIPYLERAIQKEFRASWREQMILQLADFYRRSNQFEAVEELLKNKKFKEELNERVALYQIRLSKKKDNFRHSIGEVSN